MVGLDSKLGKRVLAYFFSNPSQKIHLRKMAARLSMDPANLSREMSRLLKAGLFKVEAVGRMKFYSLNRAYPLYKELASIIFKTAGVEGALRSAMRELKGVEESYLFGSFASGKTDEYSDIDLLIVGSPDAEVLGNVIALLEKSLGRPIQYRLFSRNEFERRRKNKDPFLKDIFSKPLISLRGEL